MIDIDVLQNYTMKIDVEQNDFHFKFEQLFHMAMRINEKRRFLFVSKVLGKHLALPPHIPLLTARLLAQRFLHFPLEKSRDIVGALKGEQSPSAVYVKQSLEKFRTEAPLRIIGFAETATALGHGFFECFEGDVQYVHTTREKLLDLEPIVTFEEEHSHASTHRLYGDPSFFVAGAQIVLVDDEMTTGKTNLNIIEQLHDRFPKLTKFTLVSILDWRSPEAVQAMEQLASRRGIVIESVSLLRGRIAVQLLAPLPKERLQENNQWMQRVTVTTLNAADDMQAYRSIDEREHETNGRYFRYSGRFALTAQHQANIENVIETYAQQMRPLLKGERILVLGTGEFMYVPMKIAIALGDNVKFHATTRSPIYPHIDTVIQERFSFESIEMPGVNNYLYNVPANTYDTILLVTERLLQQQAAQQLAGQLSTRSPNVHIITLGGDNDGTEYEIYL